MDEALAKAAEAAACAVTDGIDLAMNRYNTPKKKKKKAPKANETEMGAEAAAPKEAETPAETGTSGDS